MTRPKRYRRGKLALLLATIGITASVIAQAPSQGPIVFGKREQHEKFTLNWWRAAAEATYRYQNDEQSTPGNPPTTFTEHRYEETFTLETNSSIYHPNLFELNAAGTFGLTQTEIKDDPGDSDSQFGTIYEWDINALFLRKENTTYTLYTRRTVDTISRTLGPTIDNTITQYGGIVDIRNVKVPTRIEIFRSVQEQSGIDDQNSNFTLEQNALLWHSEYRPTDRHTFTLDYSLNQVTEATSGFPANDYLLHDFTFTHTYTFGQNNQHSLESAVNYFKQDGDFPLQRIRWTENLRLRHSKTFETDYRYVMDQQEYQGNTQTLNRVSAGFTHRLYKSLVTTGEAGVEKIDQSDSGGSTQYYGNIRFDYTKSVPLGLFDGGLGYAWSRQENQPNDGINFLNQLIVFTDPAPIILTSINGVDPQSIVLTSASGFITYIPGVDYIVRQLSNRVEIDRVVGGRIEDGQAVLVDYTTLPAGGNTATTKTFSLSLRYNFERGILTGLSPYFRFVKQDQTIDTDDLDTFIPNSFTDTIAGVEYRIWKFTLGYEREWYDSTIQPFNATRYTARYVDRLWRDTVFNADARYEQLEYLEEDNQIDFLIISATLSHRFSNELNGSATVLYREEHDQLRGDTTGLEEQLEVYWQKRQLRVFAQLRNVDVTSDFEDRHFQFFRIGLRREF